MNGFYRCTLCLAVFSFLTGCFAVNPKNSIVRPPAVTKNESVQQYLDKSLAIYKGEKVQMEKKTAVVYKLPDVAERSDYNSAVYGNLAGLCESYYNGTFITEANNARFHPEGDKLIKAGYGSTLDIMAASRAGSTANISPKSVQDTLKDYVTKRLMKQVAPAKLNYFIKKYHTGFCVTKDQQSSLFNYHYGITFYTIADESLAKGEMSPLYVIHYDNAELLNKRQLNRIKNMVAEGQKVIERQKKNVEKYVGVSKSRNAEIEYELFPKGNYRYSSMILKLKIANQSSEPQFIPVRDISAVRLSNGNTYSVGVNDEQSPGTTSSNCSFANNLNDRAVVNPGVTCTVTLPIHIGGFETKAASISLIKGSQKIQMKPYTEFDDLKKRYQVN